jgi:hypothetical protein
MKTATIEQPPANALSARLETLTTQLAEADAHLAACRREGSVPGAVAAGMVRDTGV